MLLSYDGHLYHGWQIQKHQNTIQAELEKALARLTGHAIKVCGAGRTDAQVHALNQTANFFSEAPFTAEKWRVALNAVLPSDIVVKCVLSVPATFHARHSARAKRYRYLINNRPYPCPFSSHNSWWIRKPLNFEAMEKAAKHFIGQHDFSAFRSVQCSSPSALKTIHELTLTLVKNYNASLCIEIKANSFLQHMVRIIVGTLVAVGENRLAPNDIPKLLHEKDRQKSGKTAPPYGLYMLKTYYDEAIQWPAEIIDS